MLGAPGAEPLLSFLGANTSEMSPRQGHQLPEVVGRASLGLCRGWQVRAPAEHWSAARAQGCLWQKGSSPAPQHHHPQLGFEAEEDLQGLEASPHLWRSPRHSQAKPGQE